MECHLAELKQVKFTREPLEVKVWIMEKVAKLIDAVQWQTEQAIHCCTLFMDRFVDIIRPCLAHLLLSNSYFH